MQLCYHWSPFRKIGATSKCVQSYGCTDTEDISVEWGWTGIKESLNYLCTDGKQGRKMEKTKGVKFTPLGISRVECNTPTRTHDLLLLPCFHFFSSASHATMNIPSILENSINVPGNDVRYSISVTGVIFAIPPKVQIIVVKNQFTRGVFQCRYRGRVKFAR